MTTSFFADLWWLINYQMRHSREVRFVLSSDSSSVCTVLDLIIHGWGFKPTALHIYSLALRLPHTCLIYKTSLAFKIKSQMTNNVVVYFANLINCQKLYSRKVSFVVIIINNHSSTGRFLDFRSRVSRV